MNALLKSSFIGLFFLTITFNATAQNQTPDTSPILPESGLPFSILIEQANFILPVGIHSGMIGLYQGLWVFIAGRTNGLHGFGPDPFPVSSQNTSIYVVNPQTGVTHSRSLLDPSSGLTQQQIDFLSVVSPQGYQENNTLYMTGGYGIETDTGFFSTKPVLTAIYLPGIVDWVMGRPNTSVIQNILQLSNPIFQVTGGEMLKLGNVTQLVFGQNFAGVYTPSENGQYTEQIFQFAIQPVPGVLSVDIFSSKPFLPDPSYRRRDLNVVPAIIDSQLQPGLIAYSGVFTPGPNAGIWTVPVVIDQNGNPSMANPAAPNTFKQGMNNYVCANTGLYSRRYRSMYNIFFGGMSYGFFSGGVFQTDAEIPFINQVTTIRMDANRNFTQFIMNNEYPVILSTTVNPGNPLLFGSGAYFIANNLVPRYQNGVMNLDSILKIRKPVVIGYIAGGIMSTLPNTNTDADSMGSPYVFRVTLIPRV